LLYVTESVPNRDPVLGDGSSMIPFEIIQFLPNDIEVTLLTFCGDVPVPREILHRCSQVIALQPRSLRLAMARSLVSPLQVGAEERSTAAAVRQVRRLSAERDATIFHGPHVMFLARQASGPIVIQSVDPWSLRIGMESSLTAGLRTRYRARKARQAGDVERRLPEHARLLTVGAADATAWSSRLERPVSSIPNGVQSAVRPARSGGPPVVCFVGSLNYEPNMESARILATEIAPQVWQSMPETRFVVAGRQPGPKILALAGDRIEIKANVPSVLDVFHSSDVAVFPDQHGLGIRNSVGEALAAGLPVVATAAAAREQPAHPLLSVEPDQPSLLRRLREVLSDLRLGQGPGLTNVGKGRRHASWSDVALAYRDELYRALGSDHAEV